MKVYLEPANDSRGIMRVRDALVKYAPSDIEIVDTPSQCDLAVIHVYGRHDRVQKQIEWLKKNHKPYAMVQYAIRSTMNPNTKDWLDMWSGARLVWSYYNLAELLVQDLGDTPDQLPFKFYYAPLGVDSEVFYKRNDDKRFVIGAASQHYLAEGAKECHQAAQAVEKKMFFLGHDLRREGIVCRNSIQDQELAWYYSRCEFISGLRRVEGFELPVIEGLMCGARPIVYDAPHYRKWFDGLAEFITETDREGVIDQLTELFKRGARPVSPNEVILARKRFDWSIIIGGFWDRILS